MNKGPPSFQKAMQHTVDGGVEVDSGSLKRRKCRQRVSNEENGSNHTVSLYSCGESSKILTMSYDFLRESS